MGLTQNARDKSKLVGVAGPMRARALSLSPNVDHNMNIIFNFYTLIFAIQIATIIIEQN